MLERQRVREEKIKAKEEIFKAKEIEGDALGSMAEDMTTKEPMGIVYSDTQSIGIQPFNLTSDHENLSLTDVTASVGSEYERVLNLQETNNHPFNFNFDIDIYIEKGDEPLTLLQEQTQDGQNFGAWSSRLGLRSYGVHDYYAFRHR